MLSSVTELHAYIDPGQLTTELGGTQEYHHDSWISHRTVRRRTHMHSTHFKVLNLIAFAQGFAVRFGFLMQQCLLNAFSAGNRGICHDGKDDSADPAGIWH